MAKLVEKTLNLLAYANSARPTAKLGQALGPIGVNMAQFCKDFNEKTTHIRADTPLRVHLTAYKDKTFKFDVRSPPTSWMIKKAAGIEKGSNTPGRVKVGVISAKSVYEIAKIKLEMDKHLKNVDEQAMASMIAGSCRSMGVHIAADPPKPPAKRIFQRKVGVK